MTEPVTYTPPEPNAALVVGPHDVLVLLLPNVSPDELAALKHEIDQRVSARLAGRMLLIGGGGGQIVVVRDVPVVAGQGSGDPPSPAPPG